MAGVTGLEPAASGVTGRRSNQLSYTPCESRSHHVIDPLTGVKESLAPAAPNRRRIEALRFPRPARPIGG